jgi:SAM-dependent methyltransferase
MTSTPTESWNKRYSEEGFAYGDQPNNFLKKHISLFPKSSQILFPAEGEGRNACFASLLGHHVTAFDISEEGKKKAQSLMKLNHTTFDYAINSTENFPFDSNIWDGIILIYCHIPKVQQRDLFQKIENVLKPGGVILMECFSESHLQYRHLSNVGGPADLELLYNFSDIQEWTKNFEVLYSREELVELSEGRYHQGQGAVIRGIFKKV